MKKKSSKGLKPVKEGALLFLANGIARKTPKGLNPDKLDEAVLAMLSLGIIDDEIAQKTEIQAENGFDCEVLERLHGKGFLATPPNLLPDRPVWLTPKGARRAHALFRKMFCE